MIALSTSGSVIALAYPLRCRLNSSSSVLREASAASTSRRSTVSASAPLPMPASTVMQISAAAMTLHLMRRPPGSSSGSRDADIGVTPGLCGFIQPLPDSRRFEVRIAPLDDAGNDKSREAPAKGIETGSSCHRLKKTEAAKGTASKQQPQRVDTCRE